MKNIKRIAAALLVLIMALTLTACGKPDLEGKWVATGGSLIDGLLTELEITSMEEVGLEFTYEFFNDGVLKTSVSVLGSTEYAEGIWKVDGNTLTVEFEDGPNDFEFDLSGDKLTITTDGYDIVFKKAD